MKGSRYLANVHLPHRWPSGHPRAHAALLPLRSDRRDGSAADYASGFYYGFLATALTWQVLFAVISTNPQRYIPMMPVTLLEKFSYALTLVVRCLQGRMHGSDMLFAARIPSSGSLFLAAFL